MGSKRILLINNSGDELRIKDLIDAGFKVETVQSADEAAEKLASADYAGIVLASDTSTGKSDADEAGRNARVSSLSPPEAEWQFAIADIVADRTETNLAYLDTEFNFVWVNSAYAEQSRYTKEELIGRNHFDLFPNEENQGIFERVRETGEPYIAKEKPFEFSNQPERGVTYWNWTLTPVRHSRDPVGTARGFTFTLSDVTDEVRARRELERTKAELESFIASMADGVILFGSDGKVKLINDAGRRILGAPPEEPVDARREYEFYSMEGEPLSQEDTAALRALRGEHVRDFHYKIVSPWGREFFISASAAPVRDSEGRIIGATDVFRDVSERVYFEQQRESLLVREHRIAEVLQQALIPPRIDIDVPGCKIAVYYEPALAEAEVGGDFYDVFELKEGKFGVLIGDVAGKGLAAAIRVSAARHAIRSYAYLDPRPGLVLTLANDALSKEKDGLAMLTVFFAVLDIEKGTLTYANGGHESPLVRDAEGNVEELYLSGRALGILGGFTYPEAVRELKPGEVVVMTTDGITEARRRPNVLFGKEGVIDYLKKNRQMPVHEIPTGLLNAAKERIGGNMQDDVAIVAIEYGR